MRNLITIGLVLFIFIAGILVYNNTQHELTLPVQQVTQTESSSSAKIGVDLKIPLQIAEGFKIGEFSSGISQARDLQFSPGGVLLVSSPSQGRVYGLPDKDNNGVVDAQKVVLEGLSQAHGLAFYDNKLYVAGVTTVSRYSWDESSLTATKEKDLFSLPSNNNHNKRTITFDKEGNMFVSVGSTCNVCNEVSSFSATVLISDSEGNAPKVYANGLRNAPFLKINPNTGELWGTEMGRDNLGDNIPPDEINIIRGNPSTSSGINNYGWPICYGNKVYDTNFRQQSASFCQSTISPIYQIAAHSAPLGLNFIQSSQFPADWQGDLFVALHGSWNRSTPIGYKVVKFDVEGNEIKGESDFITGFRTDGEVLGRPVDIEFDKEGSVYISDDLSGAVYKVVKE